MKREFTKNMQVETHLHTNASLSDGAMSFTEALKVAKERGLRAIAITNHGNAADLIHAWHWMKEEHFDDVQLIFGIEAYIEKKQSFLDDSDEKTVRQHLILLVRTKEGYQNFCRFISDTERNKDSKGFPVATMEMLQKHFGGKDGIICTSACFAGPISYELLYNRKIDREISKIQNRINRSMNLLGDTYNDTKRHVNDVQAQIAEIDAKINELTPTATKKFAAAKRAIKKAEAETQKALEAELEIEMLRTEEAKESVAKLKDTKKTLNASIRDDKKYLTSKKNSVATIEANVVLIRQLEASKRTECEMYENAKKVAKQYQAIFGAENFYIELQYHGYEEEKVINPSLVKIAHEIGAKISAANDAHMARPDDFKTREYIRNVAGISQKREYATLAEADKELYIKTAEEKYEFLCQTIDEDEAYTAIVNSGEMVDRIEFSDIEIFGKHYPSFKHADDSLRNLAKNGFTVAELEDGRKIEIKTTRGGIKNRYGAKWDDSLEDRFDYEMSIISKMGFSSYFLYIADVICKCKALYGTSARPGTPIGPGRGSGAGSIICYLSTITELEPISLNLLFERFLNPNRVSMPDIDTDFSKEARAYAIKYVTEFYGSKKVAGIMTMAKMGPKAALTYGPKLYAKSIGLEQKAFELIGADMRSMVGDSKHLSEIEEMVTAKYSKNKDAMGVWDAAKRLEGTIQSYGQHAAGIISIMENDVEDFVPLMMAADPEGNEKMVIQADMIAAEANLGFIKFDFLGLKNLNVITACQKMIEEHYGKFVDTYSLDVNDSRIYNEIFATGNTNFIFQFESDGMKGMLRSLRPTRFGDLVLAVSVYRPGPMQFIDAICECKNKGTKSPIVTKFPCLATVLEETYGFPVYQEQVMQIMTVCAGFDLGHADNVRRFMSKKKADKLAAEKPTFISGCKKNIGATEEDADWLFEQLMPFAEYGFNKSHAAAYSYVSYITAWMKLYYPEEYLCCAMLEQGDKTLQFKKECQNLGIEVLPVSVNDSAVDYSVESKGKVRIGLSAVKGLKAEADTIVMNRADKPFTNIKDFVTRCGGKINTIEACILSGACDDFVKNRDMAFEFAKECRDAFDLFEAANARVSELSAEPEKNEKSLATWGTKREIALENLNSLSMPSCFEDSNRSRCAYELKYLGMFIGKSPLDDFDLTNPKYKSFDNVQSGDKITTIGIVFDYRKILTKNGDDMAFFKILDKDSNEMECVLFPKNFETLSSPIEDNMVIEIKGRMSENQNDEPQIDVWTVTLAEKQNETLLIDASNLEALEVLPFEIPKYRINNGGMEFCLAHYMGESVAVGSFNVSRELVSRLDELGVIYSVQ